MEKTAGIVNPVLSITVKSEVFEKMKQYVAEKMTSPKSVERLEEYAGKAMDIENTMREKMAALPPEEFETILRTAFQEDEWILIAVGAVLGALVGLGQMFYMIMTAGAA